MSRLVSLATSPGHTLWALAAVGSVAVAGALPEWHEGGVPGALPVVIASISGWIIWTTVISLLGNWAFGPQHNSVSWWGAAWAIGLAQGPGVIRVLGVVEGSGPAPAIAAFGGQLAAMMLAARVSYGLRDVFRPITLILVAIVPWLILQIGVVLLLDFALS
jgi:hypothetical protein